MRWMKKISKIAGFMLLSIGFFSHSYAGNRTLTAVEQQIYTKYADQDFYSINQQLESEVLKLVEKNADSYAYSFPRLSETLGLSIHYSTDQLFEIYTFDVGSGGTMGKYSSYVQLRNPSKNKLQAIEAGFIRSVDQVTLSGQPIYLIQSYYKGDSCVGAYQIQTYIKQKNQLNSIPIFQTKTKKLDKIQVDYDCRYDAQRKADSILVSKYMRFIDIKLLDQQARPTGNYLR